MLPAPRPAVPGTLLRRVARTARSVTAVVRDPPFVTPGHFYSPLTTGTDRRRALSWTEVPGMDLNSGRQRDLGAALGPVLAEPLPGPRYVAANTMFCPADAAVYRA